MLENKSISILIVDPDTLIRAGLRSFLSKIDRPMEIIEATSRTEAEILLSRIKSIDITFIEIQMPGIENISTFTQFQHAYPDPAYVVLSVIEERTYVHEVLKLGVRGYIPKSSSSVMIIHALRLILDGEHYVPPPPSAVAIMKSKTLQDSVNTVRYQLDKDHTKRLTLRQSEVLQQLIEGKSNKEIAHYLGLAEGTVKIHITGIFKTLNVNNRTQAVVIATGLRNQGLL